MTALSCGLTTLVLLLTMLAAETHGWPVIWTLFVAYGLIGTVNIMIEGIIFNIFPLAPAFRFLAFGLVTAYAVSVVIVLVAGRMSSDGYERQPAQLKKRWQLRLPVLALAYIILFFVAGGLVYPYVRHFYENRIMPSMGAILGVEFLRGLVYALAMLPFAKLSSGHRWRAQESLVYALQFLAELRPCFFRTISICPRTSFPITCWKWVARTSYWA